MIKPRIPSNEEQRINTLHSLDILDTPPEERYDRFTRIAKRLFSVPIALVSLVDTNRQWFKSCVGLDTKQTNRDISFCGHAILGDECFIVPDASQDERFSDNPLVTGKPNIRFYAGHPLKYPDGSNLGTLCIIDTKPRTFDEEDIEALRDLAYAAEDALAASHMATIDTLTTLNNKRGFEYLAGRELALCKRHNIPASLIYTDLNKFKMINDKHGHCAGDMVLKLFGNSIQSICRESDIPCRLHGDEFVLLLIHTTKEEAALAAERLQQQLSTDVSKSDLGFHVSFSYGIKEFDASTHSSVLDLLNDADSEMYKMKNATRLEELNTDNIVAPAILIIDDNSDYTKLLSALIMASFPNANITVVDPNEYSLGQVDEDESYIDYDIIFLDYALGGFKNGLDWFTEKSTYTKLPPVVLNSAVADHVIAARAIERGVMDFLPKTEVSAVRAKVCIDQAMAFSEALHKQAKISTEATKSTDARHRKSHDDNSPDIVSDINPISEGKKAANKFIGKYEILEMIGQGGMAKIYHAFDAENNNHIALKVIKTDDEAPEELFDRFVEEGNIASSISHPNIVTIYEEGFTDEYAFIAMELLSKNTLASKTFPLPVTEAIYYIAQIASGLSALHSKGIVHRDIKPSNVLFTLDGTPKIADFGIAKDLSADKHLTKQGMAIGTPRYMSPEQVLGKPINHLSDLYSLGIVLYELVTGTLPFPSKNQIEVMTAHVQTQPPHLSKNLDSLDRIIQTLLNKKPHTRYLSASILHDELMTLLDYDLVL